MGTDIRAKLAESNPYWIDKHRYYELKHFCLQYPQWVRERDALTSLARAPLFDSAKIEKNNQARSPVEECAEKREAYINRIRLVRMAALDTDDFLSDYILKGVTEGLSYDTLKVRFNIPCCRDTYYQLYRKFFWLLDKTRN